MNQFEAATFLSLCHNDDKGISSDPFADLPQAEIESKLTEAISTMANTQDIICAVGEELVHYDTSKGPICKATQPANVGKPTSMRGSTPKAAMAGRE